LSSVEEKPLHALMTDADFWAAAIRRDQIVIACKHLEHFEVGEKMCCQTIRRFFGVDRAIISSRVRLAEQPFRLTG
jgi:hypothetical protein